MSLTKPQSTVISPAVACVVTVAGLMLVAVCFTVLGTTPTLVALALPIASAAAVYVIRRPRVMLTAMVVIEVTNLAGVVAERSPLPITQASLGLGMLTVAVSLRDPVMRGRLNRGTVLCLALVGCYLVTQVLAMLGSQSIDDSITA